MLTRTFARIGLSALAAVVVLLSVVASGYMQSGSHVYLPIVRAQSAVTADDTQDVTAARLRPTIILVHGAWADGTGWQHVIPLLEDDGYTVIAVQNPLSSLATDVATTKRVIDAETAKGPVIVVGHSYGGAVITGAAAGNPNVKALVYISAFAPDAGEPVGAYLGQYPTDLGTALVPDAAGFLYLDRAKFRDIFAKDVDKTEVSVMAAAQKPVFADAFSESVPVAAWSTIPSWYIVATQDKALSPDMERFYANRMNAKITELKSSHVPFISQPKEVVKVIEKAAKATVQ
ncbi:MAG: alpha/beta hydrolase [Chloroflexi bacterium]|nr:alpha/beta hydrolase [Chloroflexota bacterium]